MSISRRFGGAGIRRRLRAPRAVGGGDASWLTVAGYSSLFETVAPSSIAVSGSDVTTWTDSTGNFTASPPGSNTPSFPGSTQANGFDGVFFERSSGEILDTGFSVDQDDSYTLGFVIRTESPATSGVLFSLADLGVANHVTVRILSDGRVLHFRPTANHLVGGAITFPAIQRVVITWDGTSSYILTDSVSETSGSLPTGTFTSNVARLGNYGGTTNDYLGAHVYCAVVYGGASGVPASASLRAQLFADLGSRFGL